jgi:DNA/RNA-binding protein KIN17
MRQIAALGNNAGKVISDFSKEFEQGFVSLLSRRFGTARVNANKVYQEYIQERHHLHMNATPWVSLSEFVKHLGRQGICKVEEITDEGQFGWYLKWIDNSPAALARQDALQKMERAKTDEEGRMRKYLKDQIERAQQSGDHEARNRQQDIERKAQQGLRREEGNAPVKIGVSLSRVSTGDTDVRSSPVATTKEQSTVPSTMQRSNPFKIASNPLRKPASISAGTPVNAFKAASQSTNAHGPPSRSTTQSMTAAERIMAEEQALREKRKTMGPQPNAKRMRM